jgi:quinol monooxygenase YgiN
MTYPVLAEVPLKPESFEAAVAAVRAIVPATLAEEGCEQFSLHRAADGGPRLFIYERWRDRGAFDFHHSQPYTRDVYRSYEQWLDGPVKITELSDLD